MIQAPRIRLEARAPSCAPIGTPMARAVCPAYAVRERPGRNVDQRPHQRHDRQDKVGGGCRDVHGEMQQIGKCGDVDDPAADPEQA